jgi:hypothetical protein
MNVHYLSQHAPGVASRPIDRGGDAEKVEIQMTTSGLNVQAAQTNRPSSVPRACGPKSKLECTCAVVFGEKSFRFRNCSLSLLRYERRTPRCCGERGVFH